MKFKPRYRFWQILLGIVCLGVIAAIFYYASGAYKNHPAEKTPNPNANPESGLRSLHDFLYYITLLYFSINYYYNFIAANKRLVSFFKLSAAIVLAAFAYKTFLFYCFPGVLHNKHSSPFSVYGAMVGSLVPVLIVSYLVAYITYLRETVKQRRILEAQKLQLEMQISQANFNFLKAQINPHFLHNTLNFLYAKSLPYSEELSEGILTLSDIMRYALDQGYQRDGKAPLKDEIEHVHNVIKISQLRYSNQLKVNFEVSGEVNGKMVIPFVLITLVENAFKHGDLKNQEHPIDIKLNVKGNKLYFYCSNKKKSGPKQLSTGIGLDNIKKRLELAYGDQYKFTVKDEPEFYTTELTIDKL
ncbi:MAG TPA: histidine kinase [Chitinophagaceae bacterium]|nr:histidine kinase [Chitinophagaceae bacterium]